MRSKKLYLVLIVIMVVFFLVIFFSFGAKNILQENYQATILVGDSSVWNYSEKKWSSLVAGYRIQELNWQPFEIFVDNERLGNYYVWKDDRWYVFDKDRNVVDIDGTFLAYRANYDLDVQAFSVDDNVDFRFANQVLTERNIPLESEFTSTSHLSFDFDSDGEEENFYLLTNAFPLDEEPEINFSLVYMVKNEQIYMLYDSVNEGSSYNNCKPFFTSILDTNHDHTYEIILSCGRYSIEEQIDMLYQFVDGSFKIVISNQ